MKILLLEDNKVLAEVIQMGLSKENYKVDTFNDGDKALNAIVDGYNCFILDINVPSLDGISILKSIRDYCGNIPVLIISSNHDLEKIQSSYENGCNDYMRKPFFIYELVQKVKAICGMENKSIFFNEDFMYHFEEKILYHKNEKIILAKKEILFLNLFTQNINRIVTYDEVELFVWEGRPTARDNIRALIKRLRKKLPKECIKIVSGLGYTFSSNVTLR